MSSYIGIDPGFDGGFAWIDEDARILALCDTPATTAAPREYLEGAMAVLAPKLEYVNGGVSAAIERAQAMPKQGVRSMFSIGLGFGLWRGILAARGIPYTMPRPQEWRKTVGLPNGAPKGASVALAARLFPQAAERLYGPRGGLNDGLAEALLIAESKRRQEVGS